MGMVIESQKILPLKLEKTSKIPKSIPTFTLHHKREELFPVIPLALRQSHDIPALKLDWRIWEVLDGSVIS